MSLGQSCWHVIWNCEKLLWLFPAGNTVLCYCVLVCTVCCVVLCHCVLLLCHNVVLLSLCSAIMSQYCAVMSLCSAMLYQCVTLCYITKMLYRVFCCVMSLCSAVFTISSGHASPGPIWIIFPGLLVHCSVLVVIILPSCYFVIYVLFSICFFHMVLCFSGVTSWVLYLSVARVVSRCYCLVLWLCWSHGVGGRLTNWSIFQPWSLTPQSSYR